MQRGWPLNIRSQLPRELKSCGRVYFRAPQGFSSAVRVLNLSITVGLAVVVDEGEGVGVTSSVSGKEILVLRFTLNRFHDSFSET